MHDGKYQITSLGECNTLKGTVKGLSECKLPCCQYMTENGSISYKQESTEDCAKEINGMVVNVDVCDNTDVCCKSGNGMRFVSPRTLCLVYHGEEQQDLSLCDELCCEDGSGTYAFMTRGTCTANNGEIQTDASLCQEVCCNKKDEPSEWLNMQNDPDKIDETFYITRGRGNCPYDQQIYSGACKDLCCYHAGFLYTKVPDQAHCDELGGTVVKSGCSADCCIKNGAIGWLAQGECDFMGGTVDNRLLDCEYLCCEYDDNGDTKHGWMTNDGCQQRSPSEVDMNLCQDTMVCCETLGEFEIKFSAKDYDGMVVDMDQCTPCKVEGSRLLFPDRCNRLVCDLFHHSVGTYAGSGNVASLSKCGVSCCSLGDYKVLSTAQACTKMNGTQVADADCGDLICCKTDNDFQLLTMDACHKKQGSVVFPDADTAPFNCQRVCCKDTSDVYTWESRGLCNIDHGSTIVDKSQQTCVNVCCSDKDTHKIWTVGAGLCKEPNTVYKTEPCGQVCCSEDIIKLGGELIDLDACIDNAYRPEDCYVCCTLKDGDGKPNHLVSTRQACADQSGTEDSNYAACNLCKTPEGYLKPCE